MTSAAAAIAQETRSGLQTRAFDCGSVPLLVVMLGEHATVYLPNRGATLTRVPRPSESDAAQVFADQYSRLIITSHAAKLRIAGHRYARCSENIQRAFWEAGQLRNASFRAVAADQGWTLDLIESPGGEAMRYATVGGAAMWFRDVHADETRAGANRQYSGALGAHRLKLSIVDKPCSVPALQMTLSGAVVINLDGTEQTGCGGTVP